MAMSFWQLMLTQTQEGTIGNDVIESTDVDSKALRTLWLLLY